MNKKKENEVNKEHERGEEVESHDKQQQECQLSTALDIDQYEICNFEDEVDGNNKSVYDQEEDDDTSETLNKDFSP